MICFVMRKIAVIYGSKYGATKQYATWIAEELGADLMNYKDTMPKQIQSYDIVVFGGGIYASGIMGIKSIKKSKPKQLMVFTVGLADPATTEYSKILDKNFTKEELAKIKVFHLRGGIDYKELGVVYKMMMAMVKKSVNKKPAEKRTSEDQALLDTYGQKVDFVDRSTIRPLIDYVSSL